jgi:hypothetical protein
MDLTQKAGVNNTATNLNALITNEIDSSTTSTSSLEMTKSFFRRLSYVYQMASFGI